MNKCRLMLGFVCVFLLVVSCAEDDPKTSDDPNTTTTGPRDTCMNDAALMYIENTGACVPPATDYQPRTGIDTWDACISDDNTYHRIEESISSIARVEAYDSIGDLLWRNADIPTVQNFLDARDLLDSEEGLGSRLDRRYDVHYDPPADGTSCDDEGVAALYPDYCVGPGTLRPVLNDAFSRAQAGEEFQIHAERIHAALQWFLYVSPLKEGTTCATTAKDCDSSWAYYTGGTPREAPIGLAAEFNAIAPETHNRAYDAALALRCWRDLDSAETATDLVLRDQALAQYDTALIHGMAVLIRQRFAAISTCETVLERRAALAGLRVLVPLFDRDIRTRNAAAADILIAEIAKTHDAVDTDAAVAAIDSVYQCP